MCSILVNYFIGLLVRKHRNQLLLFLGILFNLGLLAYYKYANFFIDNVNLVLSTNLVLEEIILPLAISFFTFQQIAYLVDSYRGEVEEYSFYHYILFVIFFPQLIAGPIVHHKEMMPQFIKDIIQKRGLQAENLAIGFSIFSIGLFKKIILADGIGTFATEVFRLAETDMVMLFFTSWTGALAFTFQLYFDFSGYSDMAIGLARLFGIKLPLNFNSPYKATSIIDFWRRWHITLSRFLRDYLYISLGGNRKGEVRRLTNLMITMLIGGLWHGAGWTFVLWGGLHGCYLVINHGWRKLFGNNKSKLTSIVGWGITQITVVIAWVPFRAETLYGTKNIISGMLGLNGYEISPNISGKIGSLEGWFLEHGGIYQDMLSGAAMATNMNVSEVLLFILLLASIAYLLPNTQQIMGRYKPAFEIYKNEISYKGYSWLEWSPKFSWALLISLVFSLSVLSLTKITEFLYYQF
jgi:D-alanyl-lipoteichoic acid acyltransferase DltB (MBOAT superfamily)